MCGVRWCPTVLPAGGSPPFSGANAVRHQRTSRRRIPSLFGSQCRQAPAYIPQADPLPFGSHNIGNGLEFGEFAVEVEVLLHYDVDGHQRSVLLYRRYLMTVLTARKPCSPGLWHSRASMLPSRIPLMLFEVRSNDTIFMWSRLCLFRISAII